MEKKATDRTCLKIYNTIESYPKPCQPIRYPPRSSTDNTTFHDLILSNLNALVPNVDMALHSGYDQEEIQLWIQKIYCYVNELHVNFRNKCDLQLTKLNAIKEQEIKCQNLDMKRVDRLPDDLIRYIHEFLLPETRIQMLIEKYPLFMQNLNRITCVNLKKYLACIDKKYVIAAMSYFSKCPDRHTCIVDFQGFSKTFTKKEVGLKQLSNVFDALRNAIPKKPGYHRFFQKKALRFLLSLIYIGVYQIDKVRRNK